MKRKYDLDTKTFRQSMKKCMTVSLASIFLAGSVLMSNSAMQSVQAKQAESRSVARESDVISSSENEIPETSKGAFEKYEQIEGINENTILGADFTNYQQCLGWEKEYKNYMSQPVDDIFAYVKEQGINTISLKVAVNPTGDDEYLSLDNAIKTLKAVKQSKANLKTNVVLLYSDSITYANEQKLPEGWTEDTAVEKAQEYTKETIARLRQENVVPDMVTIGNEVNWNFLGITEGQGWTGWETMGKISDFLTQSGIKSVVSLSAPTKVADMQYIIKKLDDAKVDYSYIGVNLYPDSNTNTYMKELRSEVEKDAPDKQLIVSSVKYDRVNDDNTANVYTQADHIYNLLSVTIDKKNAGGLIYDNAANAGSYTSLFDSEGDAQVSLAIFAYAKKDKNEKGPDTSRDPYKYGDDTGLKQQEVTISKVKNMTNSTIQGMDISSYVALKNAGVKFYDNNGKEASLLKVLHDNGINYIRIRIWNDPKNEKGQTYGGGGNDVETGLKIAKEASQYGMKILLDFHYSDFWADPAQQIIPKAWEADKDNTEKMSAHVYEFTRDTVTKFQEAGAEVGMVQVGNEITNGMLGILVDRDKGGYWKDVWGNTEKSQTINSYLSAGSRAVRETAPKALIALQLETPNLTKYQAIMDTWERDGVDYDVLASSYYPFWSTEQKANTPDSLKKVQEYAASRGKLFVVAETAWANSLQDADGTPNSIGESADTSAYDVGPQGQVDMLTELYNTVLSQDNGLGAFYWEGAWLPVRPGWTNWEYNKKIADEYGTGWASVGANGYFSEYKMYYNGEPAWGGTSWDNEGLFDDRGYPLDSLRFYKDAVSSDTKYSRVVITLYDKANNILGYRVIKIEKGKSVTYTLPDISGYTKTKNTLQISGTGEELTQISANVYDKIVIPKQQVISAKKSSYTLSYGTTYNLKAQVKAIGSLTFTSSNTSVASVGRQSGKLTLKKPGKVTIRISAGATKDYKQANKNIIIYVVPKQQTVKKLSAAKKKIKVVLKKDTKATGYQILVAKDSKFSKGRKVFTKKGTKQVTYTITKLTSKKVYYVKARSYKTIGNKKYFASWSKIKKIKVK